MKKLLKKTTIILLILCLCAGFSSCSLLKGSLDEIKYSGHGFNYMNGYSTTDFKDYMVYSENSKLVSLDHPASFSIENPDEMPKMDGAEACYPLYAAYAKAVYKDIDKIEKEAHLERKDLLENISEDKEDIFYHNGKIVRFTNTVYGFDNLLYEDADLFFGARPSREQLDYAEACGIDLTITPIGREGFVFFTEADNPVDNLTSDQAKAIYHGDITNWKELGGNDEEIIAFQRPEDSGSQTMMEYFMGDVSLKEPKKYETVDGMFDAIEAVAQYHNEKGALGYTFRYFLEGLNQEKGVKMLSVDGVYPSLENIENGTYPIIVDVCLTTRTNDENPNVQKMIDFILSDDGQEIMKKTGYAPIAK